MPSRSSIHFIIIGGGAAGFFAALRTAVLHPTATVAIYERSSQFLAKVKISGGGRCNVTHNCMDPNRLAKSYPRGSKELRGAFHRWQPQDTIQWFADRGVTLKTEPDGRMFPTSDKSQSIIDCFMEEARAQKVNLNTNCGVRDISLNPTGTFTVDLTDGKNIQADGIIIAAGSLKSSPLSKALNKLGHSLTPLAPSLFAFNVADPTITALAGLSVSEVKVQIEGDKDKDAQTGPLLITHRGLSGPAILRLSAWQARRLQEENYQFTLKINWLGNVTNNQLQESFSQLRQRSGKNKVRRPPFESIPRRLWDHFLNPLSLDPELCWAQLPKDKEIALINTLSQFTIPISGKTTNKDEFVTCGGVALNEVDFRRMESRIVPHLHFAGECLDLDGITGGFNFQAAWTTGHIAGSTLAVDFLNQ